MIQEIIALTIVAGAVIYTLRKIIAFFSRLKKGVICSCATCPLKNTSNK
jgi:hypothetical protein